MSRILFTPGGGSPGPHRGVGEVEASGRGVGGLQAHTGGAAPCLGGSRPGGVSQHALRQPPPLSSGYCCGRYASYWNAFLLGFKLSYWPNRFSPSASIINWGAARMPATPLPPPLPPLTGFCIDNTKNQNKVAPRKCLISQCSALVMSRKTRFDLSKFASHNSLADICIETELPPFRRDNKFDLL